MDWGLALISQGIPAVIDHEEASVGPFDGVSKKASEESIDGVVDQEPHPLTQVHRRRVFDVTDGVCGSSPMSWNGRGPWFWNIAAKTAALPGTAPPSRRVPCLGIPRRCPGFSCCVRFMRCCQ